MEKAGSSKMSDASGDGASSKSKLTSASPSRSKRPNSSVSKGVDDDLNKKFNVGDDVLAIWSGTWHRAKVMNEDIGNHPETGVEVPCYLIHYPGFAKRYDEYMMADSLMLLNPENEAKANAENAETKPGSKPLSGKKKNTSASKKPKTETQTADVSKSEDSSARSTRHEESTVSGPPLVSGDEDATGSPRAGKGKPKSTKKGRQALPPVPVLAAETAVTPVTQAALKKEEREASVSVPPEDRSESGVREDEGAEEEEKHPVKKPRNDADAALLLGHYGSYDPNNPAATYSGSLKDRVMYESLSSLGLIPPSSQDAKKTPEEKQATFMRATKQLMFMKCAELRKAQDEAVMSVDLPAGIRRLMAENYFQTVLKEKILKNVSAPEKSFRSIMDRYIAHAEKAPEGFTFYQQKARIAEARLLVENFPKMFPSIAMRMEWPQWTDVKRKSKKDLTAEYGLVHVVRAIRKFVNDDVLQGSNFAAIVSSCISKLGVPKELMVEFFNLEGKRLVGGTLVKLMAIYQDILMYLENHELKRCDEGDAMYAPQSDEYVVRIPPIVFETEEKDAVWHPFHFLGDKFFDTQLAKAVDSSLKLTWNVDSATAHSET